MNTFTKLIVLLILQGLVSGCASNHYSRTNAGTLSGKLLVQWIKPDQFIFRPDKENPLTFTRSNKKVITPKAILTDGGSIPRPLWAIKSYSPWGYAPAFIVHDWLFEMKHCDIDGHQDYDVHEAAQVMSEVIKTLMVKHEDIPENRFVLYSMHKAVSSKIAAKLWEDGKCDMVTTRGIPKTKPLMEYTIEF